MKKKILILTYDDISRDPRAHRQIFWLKSDYEVHVVCHLPDESYGVKFIKYPEESYYKKKLRLLLLVCNTFETYTWSKPLRELASALSKKRYDLMIVHHLNLLPLAFEIAGDAKVVLDAHEYYPELYDDSFIWRFFMKDYYSWLSATFLEKCDLTIAVNKSMQEMYTESFNIPATFITNAVDYTDLAPSETDANNIRIIHHGLASQSRKIELMIEMMQYLDKKFTLTLILLELNRIGSLYARKLKKLAKKNPNIFFMKLLPASEIVKYGNSFDIGLFFMPPSNRNEEYSLGNKVFQYIQSRLVLAFSPLPEMKKVVETYDLGIVCEDCNPKTLAQQLNQLTPDKINYYKNQSHKFAKELSADANRDKFREIVAGLLN